MERWRVLNLETHSAHRNMAIDEAVLRHVSSGKAPNTIRFYRWHPSAVSIGYFQSLQEEVDVDYCGQSGIGIVRRITGGGAVYHDFKGEVTYSVILRERDSRIPSDILASYPVLCEGIVGGLRSFGLTAEFRPINDILVNGMKISGNAQTRRQGVILQHGTILADLDISTMFRALKVPKEKISDKMIKAVEERVTSVKRELGSSPPFEDVAERVRKGFEDALRIETYEGSLTDSEESVARGLEESKYRSRDWNYRR